MLVGVEHPVAARGAGEDDVGAIAEGDLAVFEHQHDRDRRSRLDDRLVAGKDRLAVEDEAVGAGARLDGHQVAVEIAALPD